MIYPALKKMAAAVALIGFVGTASATPVALTVDELGTLDKTLSTELTIGGDFYRQFNFTAATSRVDITLTTMDLFGDFGATYRFGLYGSLPTTWTSLDAIAYDDTVSIFTAPFNLVANQKYSFEIQGSASSASSTVILAASVPEPDTYALLAAGLGLLGAVARRKTRNADRGV